MRKLLAILIILITLEGLFAADLQLSIDSRETYVGQPLLLTMQISADTALERPDLKEIPGFQISPAGESRYEQRTLGSGGSSRTVTMEYTWRLMPLNTGTITIPPIQIELDDRTLRSSEIEVLVREPGPIEGYHLFMTVQGDTVFPGIPVNLRLKWLFSSEVSRPEFTLPFINQENIKLGAAIPPSAQSSDVYQFQVDGRLLYAVQSAEIYEGKQYASLTIDFQIYPQEVGPLDLEAVYIGFQRTIIDKQGRKSYAPAIIPSNDLQLDVKELPADMKNFPGGILVANDSLELNMSLDQTRIYPGDPLTLTLTIEGLSSPELTDFKGFSSLRELNGVARVDKASLIAELKGSTKVYSQKIRIENESLDSFPSVTFPYYNLKKRTVETVSTEEIPLSILSLKDSISNDSQQSSGFFKDSSRESQRAEETLALKANHKINKSGIFNFLNRYTLFAVILLYILTVILLLLPSVAKRICSLRFGKKEMDLHFHLKKAIKDYEITSDSLHGQKLLDLLLKWKAERNLDSETYPWFNDLIESLEQSLWAGNSETSSNSSVVIKKVIQNDLIKQLNKGRVKQ